MSLIRLTNTKEIWTFSQLAKKRGRYPKNEDASIIKGADLLVNAAGKIVYLGPARNIPARLRSQITKTLSAEGGYVLPGFIECHTHLTFVGSRSQELDLRNQGLTYQQITQRGGGIFSTVQQVRRATLSDLININQTHLQRFYEQGVVLVEAKSGYGLNYHSETKI
ncbi:MAG: imidazolonepropionase, partial [Bdellovibrionaceae bacterium]|nr:imidazolonepropionase [Pseudobdellovibrionaceae bacterium]